MTTDFFIYCYYKLFLMRLSVTIEGGETIKKVFDPITFQPEVLFDYPIQLHSVNIDRDINDNTSYIVTLYTKTYKIQIDRTIMIKKYKSIPNESIYEVSEYSVKLNLLQNREFIKGTIEIKEIDDNINQIMYGQFNIDAKQSDEEISPFNGGGLDNLEQVKNDKPMDTTLNICSECEKVVMECDTKLTQRMLEYDRINEKYEECKKNYESVFKQNDCSEYETKVMECESQLKQRNIEYENIEKKLIEDKTYYDVLLKRKDKDCESKVTNCNNELNYWTDVGHNNSEQIDKLELENDQLKLENDELKKQIESKNKNSNNSQSTQTTIIIICVFIIVLLLGLCIYLYFFKR